MKKAYIMIGLPGSGKSTHTKKLIGKYESLDLSVQAFSTDSYFYQDGEYNFDRSKLGFFHKLNLEAFTKALEKIDVVICDNTNLKARDRNKYIKAAQSKGFAITLVFVGSLSEEFILKCAERNTHSVPLEAIRRMARSASIPEESTSPLFSVIHI